ncbi:UNVERIFIED_CONTAM: hypothetical protein HDU68_001673, partial [Siphonaria sp. JEL0065]
LAAQKYHQLSYLNVMALEERLVCLEQAVVCAILAPAGPGRSRLLATLYKDDRVRESPECGTIFYPILEKMYLDRILRASEIDGFRQTLKSHQLAKLSDGTTVLDRAVIEHNVLACVDLLGNGIRGVCEQVDGVVEEVIKRNQEWVAKQLNR